MAKGSHKTWGGWETRTCWTCGQKLTLARHTASHHYNGGAPFSLCAEHSTSYQQARAELRGEQYADFDPVTDPDLEPIPGQLELEP